MTLMLTLASVACSGTAENRTRDKKVLVVYYSATGSTERVAEYIASETGGDLVQNRACGELHKL